MLGTVRVLVVDDDDGYRDLLLTALSDAENLLVEPFADPQRALSWATDNRDGLDCVVSDFEMPGMDGGELQNALREAGVDAPFVLVSGSDSAAIPPETTADATDFVRKGAGSLFDVREAVLAATQAARKEQTLTALHGAAEALMRAEDREAVANAAVETAEEVLNFPGTGVRFHDPDRDALVTASVGGRSDEAVDERPPFPVEGTHHGRAFRTGETVTYDVPEDADADPYDAGPFGRTMYVPLGDHGVVSFGKAGDGPFDPQDVQFAETLAGHATTALDRVERECDLERERDRLEQVASVVSHDLRNPLNVVGGAVELARNDASEEAVVERLETAARATDRMESLVEDLLTLTRRGRRVEEPERVDLATAARRAWKIVETDGAGLAVDDGLGTVRADPESLAAVLENLFRNCVEHGSADGREAAASGNDVDHGSIDGHPESSDGDTAATGAAVDGGEAGLTVRVEATADGFAVADDGGGFRIEPDRAFERCVSTRERGTGLGLSIVREAVRAHGWRVDAAESAEGGARVEVETGDRTPPDDGSV